MNRISKLFAMTVVLSGFAGMTQTASAANGYGSERTAERLERDAQRRHNSGDDAGAREARRAAEEARRSRDADRARQVERSHNRGGARRAN